MIQTYSFWSLMLIVSCFSCFWKSSNIISTAGTTDLVSCFQINVHPSLLSLELRLCHWTSLQSQSCSLSERLAGSLAGGWVGGGWLLLQHSTQQGSLSPSIDAIWPVSGLATPQKGTHHHANAHQHTVSIWFTLQSWSNPYLSST